MPKIPKPDGKRAPRYTRVQYHVKRTRDLGLKQDWTLTAQRARELRAADVVTIDRASVDNPPFCICATCGYCILAGEALRDQQGRLHHVSHKPA